MYQVTAVYESNELSYGVGNSLEYAIEECLDGITSIYLDDIENIKLTILHNKRIHRYDAIDYYYKKRQYF